MKQKVIGKKQGFSIWFSTTKWGGGRAATGPLQPLKVRLCIQPSGATTARDLEDVSVSAVARGPRLHVRAEEALLLAARVQLHEL